MSAPKSPAAGLAKSTNNIIRVGDQEYPLLDIRSTGDLILDVSFKNTAECTKSIPKDAIRELRSKKSPVPSPRIFYRVRLDTLKKHSEYFRTLLAPQFAEGVSVAETLSSLSKSNLNPAEIEAEKLPRVMIVDEDTATKTLGRELIFRDLLQVLHGASPLTSPFTTHALTVLIILADRFGGLPFLTRHFQKNLLSHKYQISQDKNGEEILRQKVLIQFHTDPGVRFAAATKELILRGSFRWSCNYDMSAEYQTSWWDLPHNLEAECAYRRTCVLRTIASIQSQFLAIYSSSRERQCKLGYDSSSSCDSFQLGEMVKFLTKKGLLSLVPFQSVSPEDSDYIWPEAYTGDVDYLINMLRQCPSYQIDHNHGRCGLRTKLLPALDFIKSCIDSGLGIRITASKNGPVFDSWIPPPTPKKSFYVANERGEDVDVAGENPKEFQFALVRPKMVWTGNNSNVERSAKGLFTAEIWDWVTEPESIGKSAGLGIRPQ
ncbi:hypothetical protein NA56DRAFT_624790 [Hyaloscypha hepaticicola]|uniref:BTB domain-containing protein n=1 Tax=Hyaloscypha hepaticicola TaxID=2082293 RepID=A0A2J6Q6D5_9HELO|nr:hypothetical protein NA56DRAFT_624790 [Hyaloscypha hepaticicola]